MVGASLDAAAYIYASDESTKKLLLKLDGDENIMQPPVKTNGVDELRTVLMLSQAIIVDSAEEVKNACDEAYIVENGTSGCTVGAKRTEGKKCERCWFHDKQVGQADLKYPDLCARCNDAISKWEKETGEEFSLPIPEPAEAEPVS